MKLGKKGKWWWTHYFVDRNGKYKFKAPCSPPGFDTSDSAMEDAKDVLKDCGAFWIRHEPEGPWMRYEGIEHDTTHGMGPTHSLPHAAQDRAQVGYQG